MRPPASCPGPAWLTRRNMLQVGAIGALGLSLPRVLAAAERLGRAWLGIDQSPLAHRVAKTRLSALCSSP